MPAILAGSLPGALHGRSDSTRQAGRQRQQSYSPKSAERKQRPIPGDNRVRTSCSSRMRRSAASPRPPGKTNAETSTLVSKTTFNRAGGGRGRFR